MTHLARGVAAACHRDRVDGLAAEFAFFGVLSTFPGLLVVAALLGSLERLVGHDLASRSEALVLRTLDQVLTASAAGCATPSASCSPGPAAASRSWPRPPRWWGCRGRGRW